MTLRELIRNNLAWKLLSLLLAMLVWWHVNSLVESEQNPAPAPFASAQETETFSLPVRVLGPAQNPGGFTVVPNVVNVTLRGRRDAVERVSTTNVLVYVDATFPPDVQSATLPVVVRPPAGVTVQEVRPAGVYVERM